MKQKLTRCNKKTNDLDSCNSGDAYNRMVNYKAQQNKSLCSDAKQTSKQIIESLSGFKNHDKKNLFKEYHLIRKGLYDRQRFI